MVSRSLKNIFKESFWMAIDAIRKNKLRSSLTLLGISIGVFSVIGVMTAIRTLESSIASGLNVFAANTFVIQKDPEFYIGSGRNARKYRNRKNITIDQSKKLKVRAKIPLLVSPATGMSVRDVQYRGKKIKNSVIKNLVITDTIDNSEKTKNVKNIEVLPISALMEKL